MGRGNFKGGNVFAQNLQSGSGTKTLGGTGTDTTSIVFAHVMKNVPSVVIELTDSDVISRHYVTGKTNAGFTLNLISSNLTSAVSFDYVAFDDSFY